MDIVFNTPINSVSMGQVGINLLLEARQQGYNVLLFPIGNIDLSTSGADDSFKQWLSECQEKALINLDKKMKCIKIWHLSGGYESFCERQTLLSFYELDNPTPFEANVAKNNDTVFSSEFTCDVFKEKGVQTRYVPLAFDSKTFKVTNKRYFLDNRISFALLGKFENRKHHVKIIQAWTKKFGNDSRYYLQCAIYNPFFEPHINQNLFVGSLGGKHYFNVNFLSWIPSNAMYNDFLNSNNIVIGMSGGEGWGLPEFQSVCLGKHAVILNAHSYKGWANDENSVMVNPLNKIDSEDGVFFKKGMNINQGSFFSWDEEEFIHGCEQAIERYMKNPVNVEGIELQKKFTWENTLNQLISQ